MIRENKKEKGKRGEEIALNYLKKQGYKILERNFRTKYGEIDLISVDRNGDLVFVEVKTSENPDFEPLMQVTQRKLNNLLKTMNYYLSEKNLTGKANVRFDVIALKKLKYEKDFEICHIKNAYTW